MTDAHLKALFAEDEPPARDPAFSAAVMSRVARRRFVVDVARLAGAAGLGGLVLWALRPAAEPALVDLGAGLMPAAAAATLALALTWLLDGRVTAGAR